MYQNAALMQNLSDAKMAEFRRASQDREPRTSAVRHDVALRVARPLRRLLNH